MITKIISGGQTGADMGGLLAAELLGIPRGGYCPDDYADENGFNQEFLPRFDLKPAGTIRSRTEKNIVESDATVIFAKKIESRGTQLTIKLCQKHGKPFHIVESLNGLKHFLMGSNGVVNIAGNRESVSPGIQNRTRDFLILSLFPENGVFVFGSNSEGNHGAGAAKFAKDCFGAKQGESSGLMGRSYALVTKSDWRKDCSSSLDDISTEIENFFVFANEHPELKFFVSEIGCGLAGYHYLDIVRCFYAPYSEYVLDNVVIPKRFGLEYPINKMMYNSKQAGKYNTLDKKESEMVRCYHSRMFMETFGFPPEREVADLFLDQETKLCGKMERFVVGDHGVYAEFKPEELLVELEDKKGKEFKKSPDYINSVKYFDMNPVGFPNVLVYDQQKTVNYADYKGGMLYVSPNELGAVILRDKSNTVAPKKEKEIYQIADEKKKEESRAKKEAKDNKETQQIVPGNFVHLHVHSEYSLLDGICDIEQLCEKAKELGQHAIALTDHGYMYGNYKFEKAAAKAGIKPIHGVEAYFVNNALNKEERQNYHLVLLVMNQKGWENLCHMMTVANKDERFYYKPRIDEALLREYNEGLICLSACASSPVSKHLLEDGYDPKRARANMEFLIEIFGDRFYNEAMHVGYAPYDDYYTSAITKDDNPRILELANELGVKTVATNDVHFINKEDHTLQKTVKQINTGGAMGVDEDGNDCYLKSREEMIVSYITPEMCDVTLEIADRIEFRLEFEGYKFPTFDVTKQSDYEQFVKETKGEVK